MSETFSEDNSYIETTEVLDGRLCKVMRALDHTVIEYEDGSMRYEGDDSVQLTVYADGSSLKTDGKGAIKTYLAGASPDEMDNMTKAIFDAIHDLPPRSR